MSADLNTLAVMQQQAAAMRAQSASTLTASIVAASGRPWSIQQMMDVYRDVSFALFPDPRSGAYQNWQQNSQETLNKVHGKESA
jgi:hypothetical protein